MRGAAYIVSVKFAAGSHKEFVLLGNKLMEHGFDIKYLLSKNYKRMRKGVSGETNYITNSAIPLTVLWDSIVFFLWGWLRVAFVFKKQKPKFLYIYNVHPVNFAILKLAKFFCPEGIRAIYLHEPGKPCKKAYGFKGEMFFKIVEFSQKLAMAYSTDMILASPVGMQLFEKYFPNYQGKNHYAPLLLPNYPCKSKNKREYFSMVGRFNFSKKLDMFIKIINHTAEKNETLKFQIVTSSNIEKYLDDFTPGGKLITRVIRKKNLSDDEIGCSIAESLGVLSLQPMVTQSGVVPFAFMNSTPVIVRPDPGFTQFVRHKYNGWVLPDNFSCEDVIQAMNFIRNDFDNLSANARQTYLDLFAEKNWEKYYTWLLESPAET